MQIPEVPNPADWQPRTDATETLQSAFLKRCTAAEERIHQRACEERLANIDNFDSGPGVEDIVREELAAILPSRYRVRCGVAIDRDGRTSGDHDILVFNEQWFPQAKAGATSSSRRSYFPIEGIYAIGEIKQTLGYETFDDAMKKLIMGHQLNRPHTHAKRVVENRESGSCTHGLSNPLYSFVLSVGLQGGLTFEELINRFYDTNRQVKRLEVVRALCVLGHGTVVWGYDDRERGGISPAKFMLEDLYEPILPMYFRAEEYQSALFALLANLSLHLFDAVLAPEDIAALYGSSLRTIKAPKSADVALPPDPDRLESLKHSCPS
jgi:hypothetical protein